jgi:ABC-2 type transport system ATP-binding protein
VSPPGTRRLEIVGPDVARLLERLRDRPGVHSATIFGQAVHALVDADRTPEELGIADFDVREAGPSLEDVFGALARQPENNRG